ncbi:phosphotransferase enzyme family protein [Psychrobacillus sp. BM2]|uniref:phosphotransferase enzyme family protein n=1 Tax=Psychrobacillus sp. BM2 TaxID=3400421 RepID=UPI003B01E9BD
MTTNHIENIKSHGMGKDAVERTWMTMNMEEVTQLLSFFPQFNEVTTLLWHSPRPFSSATIALIDGEKYFIKRHSRDIRDVEGLKEEHGILSHLYKQGLPVSEVVTGADKNTAFTIGEWTYEIHLLGTGVDVYQDAVSWSPFMSDKHAFAAGEMLAKMHLASSSYDAPERKVRPLVSCFEIWNTEDPIEATKKFAKSRPGLARYLAGRDWELDFQQELFPFYKKFVPYMKKLRPLWTHNDWHASNLLWTDHSFNAEVSMVLDFGLSNVTSAVYDLATALERNVVTWLEMETDKDNLVHFQDVKALLEGYTSVRSLSETEKQALLTILPIVHTDFALSEIDYFVRITKSNEDADLAYYTFLLGHAKWFNSLQGKQLLKEVVNTLSPNTY